MTGVQTCALPIYSTVTWGTPAAITYGTALSSMQLNATASVPGTFAYSPAAGSILSVGNQTLSATFTPTDGTDYTAANGSVVIAVVNPVPVLSSLSPAHVQAGSQALSLTVNGSSFTPTSTVYWNGAALSAQYGSSTQLVASVPASALATAGTAAVTVQTSAPGGGSSGALQFEVDSTSSLGAAPPTFTSLTATATAGSAATYQLTLPSSVISATVSCLNLPAGASCTYANGVLTITTSSTTLPGTYSITVVFSETLAGIAAAFLAPFLLLMPWGRRKRKWHQQWIAITMLGLLSLGVGGLLFTGCGGGSGGSGSGSVTHQATNSSTITLIVQ